MNIAPIAALNPEVYMKRQSKSSTVPSSAVLDEMTKNLDKHTL